MTETTPEGGSAADPARPHLIPKVPPPTPGAADTDRSSSPDSGGGSGRQNGSGGGSGRRRRRGGRGRGGQSRPAQEAASTDKADGESRTNTGDREQAGSPGSGGNRRRRRGRRGGRGRSRTPVTGESGGADEPIELDEQNLRRRRGRQRKGKPVGRYLMTVHQHKGGPTHIAILEGRSLIEHYVAREADNVTQIHGNIYLGKVQNVLPGMEAAFIDIGTPKNAVLYRGDVTFDPDEVDSRSPKIEQILKPRQAVLCQVTKNPIAHKGARLTTEVSIPGRFVVFVPNSDTYGISKRLPDAERSRLRKILDKSKPKGHGIIVRTAAEHVTAEEIERDVARLHKTWTEIEARAASSKAPELLYSDSEMPVRVIREEFNKDYRGVIIDDRDLFEDVSDYMRSVTPALADRIEFYDADAEGLPLFERHHVTEQLVKALDRKVWLPSGGSLIIEHTEALTVIDVNTGKNVGTSSLEETVFRNNLEAAEEVARQLRLRDIGGIIVIDFVDMEQKKNRDEVIRVFRDALARDKTRTQVFEISELGLVEMTRKRIGEGLLESLSVRCDNCDGRGLLVDTELGASR